MNRFLVSVSCMLFGGLAFGQGVIAKPAEISKMIDNAGTDFLKQSTASAVSIALVSGNDSYMRYFGEIDKTGHRKANDHTYFEIASVTKLLTGQLFAKAILEKKASLNDDIRKYLKGSYPNLEKSNTPITLKDLLSYESALPHSLPDYSSLLKNRTDETSFLMEALNKNYSKEKFVADLHHVKLDTIPGKVYKYSNLSLELSALVLEGIYKQDFESLMLKEVLAKWKMDHTRFSLDKNDYLTDGYDGKHRLMPHITNNLWGASGKLKSTLPDMVNLLKAELDADNPVIRESQANIQNSKTHWYGYFWDQVLVTEKGKFAFKHGGAHGTQTFFAVFPELDLGVCLVTNISTEQTFLTLITTVLQIAGQMTATGEPKKTYGYYLKNDKIVFSYLHAQNLDAGLINTVSVAGSFNGWNPENPAYELKRKGKNVFELELPVSGFEKGQVYGFKFVINKNGWTNTPLSASNTDGTADNNLTFKIE